MSRGNPRNGPHRHHGSGIVSSKSIVKAGFGWETSQRDVIYLSPPERKECCTTVHPSIRLLCTNRTSSGSFGHNNLLGLHTSHFVQSSGDSQLTRGARKPFFFKRRNCCNRHLLRTEKANIRNCPIHVLHSMFCSALTCVRCLRGFWCLQI